MVKKYLELKPEDLDRITASRSKSDSLKIDDEQLFIAEFGKHYGFGGVQAILNNDIDGETASWLLLAARKVNSRFVYDNARACLIGSASAQAKKPSQVFKKATADLVKDMKAEI